MKKFSKLFATLGAVAMLGLGGFASCKSDDGDDDNYITVKFPSADTIAALDALDETSESVPEITWKSASINIGSASSVTQDELTKKIKESKNNDLVASLAKLVDLENAALAEGAQITQDDLTYTYFNGEYVTKEFLESASDAELPDGVELLEGAINKGTVWLLAEYVTEEPPASGTQTLTAVSIEGPTTTIDYNAADVEVKAVPTATGDPEITYEWTITDESGVVSTEKTGTGNPFKFTVNNTDSENEKTISVTVKASATIDGELVEVTPESATQITIGKHGVTQPKVTSVVIGYETNKESLREFKVGQAYKLHAVVVADEGMGEVEWSANPASAVEIADASSDSARAGETAPVTITMKEVSDAVVITVKSKKDPSKFESITLKIEAATVVEEVEEDATLDWNVNDYDVVSSITAETTLGAVTAIATSSKNMTIEAIDTANTDEAIYKYGTKTFTKKLKLNGTGKKTERALKVTATKAGTIKVYAISGSSSADRVLILEDSDGYKTEKTALGSKITLLAYDVAAAGDYYIYSKASGINIFAISGLSEPKVLSKIEVTTEPTNKTYAIGDSLNTAGLVVTATYTVGSNTTTEDVTADCTLSEFVSTTAGDKTITVSYTSGSVTKTTTFTVTVDAAAATVTGISVKTQPTKVSYKAGEKFDPAGLVITVTKSDESSSDVTYSDDTKAGFTFTPDLDTALTASDTKVTVSYSSKTADVDISVRAVYSKTWSFAKTVTQDMSHLATIYNASSTNTTYETGVDYYFDDGLYLATSQNKVWFRGDKDALSGKNGPVAYTANAVKGPFTGKVNINNTNDTNTGRKLTIYIGTDKAALFSTTPVVEQEIKGQTAQDVAFSYDGTDDVYVGIGIVTDMLYIHSLTITEAASDFATADDAANILAFAKADWAAVTADSSVYKTLNQYDYVDASALTTALETSVSGDEYAPYLTAAKAVYTAYAALVKYNAPDKITVSYGDAAISTTEGLSVNYQKLGTGDSRSITLTAKETYVSDSKDVEATAGTLVWEISSGAEGLQNATISDGVISGITGAGTATIKVSDSTVRESTTENSETHYTSTTKTVDASFTLTVTNVEVKLSSDDAVTATATPNNLKVTLSAVVKHKDATEAATDWTEDLTYTWYLVSGEEGNATETPITLTDGVYTTDAAGTYNFKVKVTSASNETGIESETVSAVTNAPSVYTLDVSALSYSNLETETKIDDTVSIMATSSKKVSTATANSKTYINLSGGGVATTQNSLKLTLTKAGTITVTATGKNDNNNKYIKLLNSDGTQAAIETTALAKTTDTPAEYTVEASEAGTYYLGASGDGCRIYGLSITYK